MNIKKDLIKPLILLVVLPNIFFVLASSYFHLGRSLVNLDYLFAALLVVSPFTIIGYVLFAIFLLVDLLALVSQIFQFVRLDNLLYLSSFILEAPTTYQLTTAFGAVIILIFFWGVFSIKKNVGAAHTLVLFNLAIVIYAVSFYSDSRSIEEQRVWRVDNPPLVGSPTYYTWRLRSDLFFQSVFLDGQVFSDHKISGATSKAYSNLEQEKYQKVLLIVNESWGVVHNDNINAKLLSPLKQLNDKITDFSSGEFGFSGATVAGELRELCNLAPLHFNLKDVKEGFQHCLPHKLKQQGFNTTAFHAASGVLYDRIYWYKTAGFNNFYFFEHLNWDRRCFSYPGGCDFEIIHDVTKSLSEPGKQFVYWLTLNSHATYDKRDIVLDIFNCEEFDVDPSTQSCRNLKLQAQFFATLSKAIENAELDNALVIVVSDHAPIISDQEEKIRYFVDNKVNWLSFTVKADISNSMTSVD